MCYSIYLSTTSEEKFESVQAGFNLVELSADLPYPDEASVASSLLAFEHRWCMEHRYGTCSCHFRHVVSRELGLGPPVDWMPEDDEDIEATASVYDFLLALLKSGHQVDLVDLWQGASAEDVESWNVDLCALPRAHFRFVEDTVFKLSCGDPNR